MLGKHVIKFCYYLTILIVPMYFISWLEFKLNGVENGMVHDFMWRFVSKGLRKWFD